MVNFLFASLKLLENVYWNPPQNFLLCDWPMFSSAKYAGINLSQAASFMIIQNHGRLRISIFSVKIAALWSVKRDTWKDLQN
jgi:hypothetical protein